MADLVAAMRGVAESPGRAAALGATASAHVRTGHTWDRTAAAAAARLTALAEAGRARAAA